MANPAEEIEENEGEEKNVALPVLLDCLFFFTCGGIIPVLWRNVTPVRRGFFCDDEDIMYPAKPSSVTTGVLWGFCVSAPLSIICITEVVRKFTVNEPEGKKIFFFRFKVPYVIQQIYIFGGVFLYGLIMSELAAAFIKYLVGRLRPNFLDLCKPNFNCSAVENPHYYVTKYNCTNPKLRNENFLRMSFPSGHSALVNFAMLYTVFYLAKKVTFSRYSVLAKPLLLGMLLMPSGYVSFSRVSDNWHHWDDILAGFLIAFFICIYCIFCMTDLYVKKKPAHPNMDNIRYVIPHVHEQTRKTAPV
ncbi:putative phosphatidate phosphatase [Parasteatoda tepidariorum]|uniref:putative phosphatidate phosphatase n=1 Tax=Parasteatoda tepidariorum TaxID=114398 RepID=UPI00077FDBB5|nr:putative phosphatidate phosphatase [Parasteatoda tepidariorum]